MLIISSLTRLLPYFTIRVISRVSFMKQQQFTLQEYRGEFHFFFLWGRRLCYSSFKFYLWCALFCLSSFCVESCLCFLAVFIALSVFSNIYLHIQFFPFTRITEETRFGSLTLITFPRIFYKFKPWITATCIVPGGICTYLLTSTGFLYTFINVWKM